MVRRRRQSQFQRAADGSMTLLEHLRELRSRLFKASLGIAAGFGVGWWLGHRVMNLLRDPYCKVVHDMAVKNHQTVSTCPMLMLQATDGLVLFMQIALWIGLVVSGPIWLYQLWAFIAPGLHRN